MHNPLVSIIVCTFNRAALLEKTLESIFAQIYSPVEILVIDDGSTDGTQELIARYGDSIRYFWQENKGITASRTIGCQLAKGNYIAFQDDDDLMLPDRIVSLYEALSQNPSSVLSISDLAFIDYDGNVTGDKTRYKICDDIKAPIEKPLAIEDGYTAVMWPKISPSPDTTLFKKADAERIGWFDTIFTHGCEDTDFFARLAALGPIVYVPKVLAYYRRGHVSLSNNNLLMEYSRFLLFEKHLKLNRNERKDLHNCLKYRMLSSLRVIAFFKSQGIKLDSISPDYLNRGLCFLGVKERFLYEWYTLVRLPLRRLLKGNNE